MYHDWYFFALLACKHEKEPNEARNNEENKMQITENFLFGNWQGARLNSKFA